MRFLITMLLVGSAMAGCAPVLSTESLSLADQALTYRVLKEKPGQYKGKYAALGGIIAGVRNSITGGELEIVQYDLDSRARPKTDSSSAGRFLARSDAFLDPMVYRPGLPVSLVGQVAGEKMQVLDGIDYRYPVVVIKELQLLKPEQESANPVFHFGIGVGHTF